MKFFSNSQLLRNTTSNTFDNRVKYQSKSKKSKNNLIEQISSGYHPDPINYINPLFMNQICISPPSSFNFGKISKNDRLYTDQIAKNQLRIKMSKDYENTNKKCSIDNIETGPKKDFNSKDVYNNLYNFLILIFTNNWILEEDIRKLNPKEKNILLHIFKTKKYRLLHQLSDNIYLKTFDSMSWKLFEKQRRKEEYLKYSFKLIIKSLQNDFMYEIEKTNNQISPEKMKLMFYLTYFYHVETGNTFKSFYESGNFDENNLKTNWKLVQGYILPEMGSQSSYSKVKSISKEYLIKIIQSEDFKNKVFNIIINMNLFFCYCLNHDWSMYPPNYKFNEMDSIGISILKSISKTNKIEIFKLFSEWDNRINFPYDKNNCQESHKIIKKAIKRKNFKFPWSFKEIQLSFFELLTSFVEVFQYYKFKNSEEGI